MINLSFDELRLIAQIRNISDQLMINDEANKKATKNLSGLNSLGWLRGKKRSNNS